MGGWRELIDEYKQKADDLIDRFQQELKKLRQTAVDIDLVKNVTVNVYGQTLPLYQIGTITLINALTVQVSPWDNKALSELSAQLPAKLPSGIQISVRNNSIYITYPPLTKESQERLLKELTGVAEDFRQQLRRLRNSIKNKIEDLKQEGVVSEEEYRRAIAGLDEASKKARQAVDELVHRKQEAILK